MSDWRIILGIAAFWIIGLVLSYVLARKLSIVTPADRLSTLETAVLTIIKSMREYLPPDSGVSKDQFIAEVIGAVDNAKVFEALERGK